MRKVLLFIVLMSVFLRFHNLGVIPPWHSDEGENLSIAKNLIDGNLRLFAFEYAFVPRLPLFFVASSVMIKLFGSTIPTLRVLSAFYGVLTTVLIYLIGKELWNGRVGLLASFLFSVSPLTVYYNRMAIAHNQTMLLTALLVFSFLKYLDEDDKGRWFFLVCLTVSLALLSEFAAWAPLASLSLLVFMHDRKRLNQVLLATVPFLVFLASISLFHSDYFLHDLSSNFDYNFKTLEKSYPLTALTYFLMIAILWVLLSRVVSAGRHDRLFLLFTILIFTAYLNESDFQLYTLTYSTTLGAIGLMLIPDRRKKIAVLSFFIPSFVLLYSALPYAHRLVPLSVYTAIGMSVLFYRAFSQMPKNGLEKITFVIVLLLSMSVIGSVLRADIAEVSRGQSVGVEPLEADDAVIGFVNQNTKEGGFLVLPGPLIHLTDRNSTNMLQAMGCEGRHTPYYPAGVMERFVFNCSYKKARYVVITNRHKEWLTNISQGDVVSEIEKWPNLRIENYDIYKNPEKDE